MRKADNLPPSCAVVTKSGSLNFLEPLGHSRPVMELLYLYLYCTVLWCCAANWKVAGSIPACVSGFFIDIKSFRSHYDPGVDSASNRNEYQEYFVAMKAAGA